MTAAEARKEKALLHKNLVDILTNCPTDKEYWQRLMWALEIISNAVVRFGNTVTVEELPDFEDEEDEEEEDE